MQTKELRAEMIRYGDSNQTLANELGRSMTSISEKINGKSEFTQSEIALIMQRYRLSPEKVCDIFFASEVE